MKNNEKMTKLLENVQYLTLIVLILGQCTVGNNFYLGQIFYLIGNIASVIRTFGLKRLMADKVKDICFTAITVGLILIQILR